MSRSLHITVIRIGGRQLLEPTLKPRAFGAHRPSCSHLPYLHIDCDVSIYS